MIYTPNQKVNNFWKIADDEQMIAEYLVDQDLLKLQTSTLEELKQTFIQYRFFTLYYITDLALLIAKLPNGSLRSLLADILSEELGEGNHLHAHPQLYDNFLLSLGISQEEMDSPNNNCINILQDVQNKLINKAWAYGVGLRGMGGECLCQIYLSSMYWHFSKNPVIKQIKQKIDWVFWDIHCGETDEEHRRLTRAAINDLIEKQPELISDLQSGYLYSKDCWDAFWQHIFNQAFSNREMIQRAVA